MKPKYVVGYTLTVLVALWGLVYCPLQSIKAVQPYTANPLSVLNYDPLMPLVLVPFGMFILWIAVKIDRGFKEQTQALSPKRVFLFSLWLVSLVWPLASVSAKDRFLRNQRTWSGSCTVSDVFVAERNQLVVNLKCKNGTITQTLDGVLVNKLMQGKNVTCTTNATGSADCQP